MPVEYAIEAISHAGAAVGLRTNEGVVLAAEKKILSKVLVSLSRSPLLRVD
jgi:20S proteasome subunit alpha 3|tara:strand:+ start:523 stop:675 length:153 start_codon:yes stop_codon:yes gene_type:complete